MEEIKKIKIKDKEYPQLLKKIEHPPGLLYVKGTIPKGPCFSIVGTRRCSSYGKQIAFKIAKDLAETGLIIVSGMAKGIDTFVHKGCLEGNGKTIAVLGTGLDKNSIYPKENTRLANEIIKKGGCLISEHPSEVPGFKSNFPQRNRIISGLSIGVLIVEAKTKSGALITAKWAKKQNKKIFAVPGSIFSSNSKGPHSLIKNGAILVEKTEDILKKLEFSKKLELSFSKRNSNQKQTMPKTLKESIILKILRQGPLHIEKIIEQTDLKPQEILSILAIMEIDGKIKNLGNNIYAITN